MIAKPGMDSGSSIKDVLSDRLDRVANVKHRLDPHAVSIDGVKGVGVGGFTARTNSA